VRTRSQRIGKTFKEESLDCPPQAWYLSREEKKEKKGGKSARDESLSGNICLQSTQCAEKDLHINAGYTSENGKGRGKREVLRNTVLAVFFCGKKNQLELKDTLSPEQGKKRGKRERKTWLRRSERRARPVESYNFIGGVMHSAREGREEGKKKTSAGATCSAEHVDHAANTGLKTAIPMPVRFEFPSREGGRREKGRKRDGDGSSTSAIRSIVPTSP